MWKIMYTKQANKDKKRLKAAGLDVRAKSLIEVVRAKPLGKPPAFEPLKGNLEGAYSRRINLQHRFVYQIIDEPLEEDGKSYEGIVKVISMWTHYKDIKR